MTAALGLITIGGLMVYSAIHGVSIVDVLRGVTGTVIDPAGGAPADTSGSSTAAGGIIGQVNAEASPSKYGFKGPNAALLTSLADAATNQFNLTITSTCRTADSNAAAGGANDSWHLQCRAFDAAGAPADMKAFAKWEWANYGHKLKELFHAPAGITVKNGINLYPAVFDKPNHVHSAA